MKLAPSEELTLSLTSKYMSCTCTVATYLIVEASSLTGDPAVFVCLHMPFTMQSLGLFVGAAF